MISNGLLRWKISQSSPWWYSSWFLADYHNFIITQIYSPQHHLLRLPHNSIKTLPQHLKFIITVPHLNHGLVTTWSRLGHNSISRLHHDPVLIVSSLWIHYEHCHLLTFFTWINTWLLEKKITSMAQCKSVVSPLEIPQSWTELLIFTLHHVKLAWPPCTHLGAVCGLAAAFRTGEISCLGDFSSFWRSLFCLSFSVLPLDGAVLGKSYLRRMPTRGVVGGQGGAEGHREEQRVGSDWLLTGVTCNYGAKWQHRELNVIPYL